MPSCLRLLLHFKRAAASRTFWTAGKSRPMRMAIMAMTTSSSMSVKPDRSLERRGSIRHLAIHTRNQPQSACGGGGGRDEECSVWMEASASSRVRIGVGHFEASWDTPGHQEVSHAQEVCRAAVG